MSVSDSLARLLRLQSSFRQARRPQRSRPVKTNHRRRPFLEILESRLAPATLTVNSLADNTTDTSVLTLRDAIGLVNSSGDPTALGQASMPSGWSSQISGTFGSNDTIQFAKSLLGATQQTITLGGSELLLSKNVSIAGPGSTQLAVSGNLASRVFEIATGTNVRIADVTVMNGAGSAGGIYANDSCNLTVLNCVLTGNQAGAIESYGTSSSLTVTNCNISANKQFGIHTIYGPATVDGTTVSGTSPISDAFFPQNAIICEYSPFTLTNSAITGNVGEIYGGGIYSTGEMTVTHSTITDNSATRGGGIHTVGTMSLIDSTVADNTASGTFATGGGIFNSGTLALVNSTVSGNIADHGKGGGICSYGPVTTTCSTISVNSADSGGAVYLGSGSSISATDSILAGNSNGDVAGSGSLQDLGHNLIGGNPMLGPLQNNGGPTLTMLPLSGSPAIDAGDNTLSIGASDQRGYARIVGGAMDIGAVESGAVAAGSDLAVTGQAIDLTKQITYSLTVTNKGPGPQADVTLSDVLPTGTTLVSWQGTLSNPAGWSLSAPAAGSSGTVSAWTGSLAAGASASFVLVVHIDAPGTTISDTASVGPVTGDPNPANNSINFTYSSVTHLAISSSAAKSAVPFGAGVTIIANVNAIAPGTTPTGSVQFYVDGRPYGLPQAIGTNAAASIALSTLPVGPHGITATYSGDAQYLGSSSVLVGTSVLPIAGNGTRGYVLPGPATSSVLAGPWGVVEDSAGDLYIADSGDGVVREVSPNGMITVVAGTGIQGYSGDGGPATAAQLLFPEGLALDAQGDLFIADPAVGVIREVKNGVITTVAGYLSGFGNGGYSGDNGPATLAQLNSPSAVAVDLVGDLFIADTYNSVIREVHNGIITTVAGSFAGTYNGGYSGDNGPATAAQLFNPFGVACNKAGDLFIADTYNNVVREVHNGIITTVAGNYAASYGGGYSGDNGPATAALLTGPKGLAVDTAGDLFIDDTGNNVVREVKNGIITTVAGSYSTSYGGGYSGDNGPATAAQLRYSPALSVDGAGNLFIADTGNNVVREVKAGIITTVAGGGVLATMGDGGPATAVPISNSPGIAVDSAGDLFFADPQTNVVREVTPNGIVTTVAGTGTAGYSGDGGPATAAQLNYPSGIAVDVAGDLFIADSYNRVIREVKSGIITTIVSNGPANYGGLYYPRSVALDAAGDLFINDGSDVLEVKAGVVSLVPSYNEADGMAVDAQGDVFEADSLRNDVYKISSSGVPTLVAGTPYSGSPDSGDGGPATAAHLHLPYTLAVDAAGDIFIGEGYSGAIREVNTAGIITTLPTRLYGSLAVDTSGDLFGEQSYIGSGAGNVILEVPSLLVTQASTTTALTSSTTSAVAGQVVTFAATVGVMAPGSGMPTGSVTFLDGNTFTVRL